MMIDLTEYKQIASSLQSANYIGKITKITGLIIESDGPVKSSIGDLCYIYIDEKTKIKSEVVGFRDSKVLLMPLGNFAGIKPGSIVKNTYSAMKIQVGKGLIGRVLNGLGEPIDNLGELNFDDKYSTQTDIINPLSRKLIREPLTMGIRAIDAFATIGKGQRMGVFAGSGVGKSTTLGMIAKNTNANLNVIALIGERGREVREFVESILGESGMKRSIVVVATSDEPSLVKIKAAFVATAIAQYFRDLGCDVLFMLDSVTRVAMAQREVGLAVGEPPATRGYTPSVFAILPKLLERVGSNEHGTITALYTVLVEGDDFNEPISDTVRSILDGHIMLSRDLAHKNHYPAIDVLSSVSRVMNDVVDSVHKKNAATLRNILAVYRKNEDLISIGAYVKGSDKTIDKAIEMNQKINDFLKQNIDEKTTMEETSNMLNALAKEV